MRSAAALFVLAACTAHVPEPPRPAVATQTPDGADLAAFEPALRYPSGSRVVLLDASQADATPRPVSGGLDAAGAPAVRADGGRIAFVGRESAGGRFGVWTCAPDGSGRTRADDGAADCGSAAFLADGRLVWSAAAPGAAWALFVGGDGTSAPQRITFSGGVDVFPAVLADGRVAFSSRAPGGTEFVRLAVHPDGTGVAPLADDAPASAPAVRGFAELALLAPRPRPQGHLGLVDPGRPSGDVFCVDARPPGGERARRVRFVALAGAARALGDVALEADGSFFVRLPADTPLGVEVLDADGAVVAAQRIPFWVRPGETRGCVGCHEPPDTTPPNVRPAAVLADPVPLGAVGGPGALR